MSMRDQCTKMTQKYPELNSEEVLHASISPEKCTSPSNELHVLSLTLIHDNNNASIVMDENESPNTPWSPKSLERAKSAIIYKQTLNDHLLIRERKIFFLTEWNPYFISLQQHYLLLFKTRETWEQGGQPDKIIELNDRMFLGEMKVEIVGDSEDDDSFPIRRFRRQILEIDELDTWLNEELRQSIVIAAGSNTASTLSNNPDASSHCVLDFACGNQNTFALWCKCIRRVLQDQRDFKNDESIRHSANRIQDSDSREHDNNIILGSEGNSCSSRLLQSNWVSPGRDSRLTLHQSEIWCNRVLCASREKIASELRRIYAMEKLVSQVDSPRIALLVYEKVSRVHELFVANSRREIEHLDGRKSPMPTKVLQFFADHLKRKYAVFLLMTLAYGVEEEDLRLAHDIMCQENSSKYAGIGGGNGEYQRTADSYGFNDTESTDLYEKYRDAALNYYNMNFADPEVAEEEDAILHLPVMLQVAIVRQDTEEANAMLAILETVKTRLHEADNNRITIQENDY